MTELAWRWQCHNEADENVTVEGFNDTFASQSDAESWIGEVYPDLLDRGILAATLMDGDREVYRMSLEA